MKRVELIANCSVEADIIDALESIIPDFYYSLLPSVYGRGRAKYRLGSHVWPETNFMLISYLDDIIASKAKAEVQNIKEKFPNEGIKLFIMEAELA
jgi:hypothetical protein